MEESLESEFTQSMLDICRREKFEYGRYPAYFLRMIQERGGVQTAKDLLSNESPADGFVTLCWELGRPDLTAECLALNPKFQGLFTEDELRRARERLGPYANECESIEL